MTPRRLPSWIWVPCVLIALAGPAWAQERARQIAAYRAALDHALQPRTAPAPGLDQAKLRPVSWCGNVRERARDADWMGTVIGDLEAYHRERFSEYRLFEAAGLLCNAPDDPLSQRAAAEIEQLWINRTAMAEPDAFASLSLRADKDAFTAERTSLCDAIQPKDTDTQKERSALAHARYALLGCHHDAALWLQIDDLDYLARLVDRGAAESDDLGHLAWVLFRQWKELEEGEPEAILGYAIDQFDFHEVSEAAVLHQLDAAPYRGSRYARVILVESLAHARITTAKIEAMVAKRVHDPAWKELLITAPDRGAAAWKAAAERDKAALARSDEFARQARAERDKAARSRGELARQARPKGDTQGCAAALRGDVLALLSRLKHDDLEAFYAAMSDHPLVGLLLTRLARCMSGDSDRFKASMGGMIDDLTDRLRVTTGPRMAAYFATLDALSAQGDDRPANPRFLAVLEVRDVYENRNDPHAAKIDAVRKTGKTVHVTFPRKRTQVMSQSCHETNRIDRIDSNGKLYYRQVCKDTGLVWQDTTLDPVDVPAPFASGLRAGSYAAFGDVVFEGGKQLSLPLAVYKDKTGKHLVAFYGFPLE